MFELIFYSKVKLEKSNKTKINFFCNNKTGKKIKINL